MMPTASPSPDMSMPSPQMQGPPPPAGGGQAGGEMSREQAIPMIRQAVAELDQACSKFGLRLEDVVQEIRRAG